MLTSLFAHRHAAPKKCAVHKDYLYLVTGNYRPLGKGLGPGGRMGWALGPGGIGVGVNAQRPPLGKAAGVAGK